MKYKVGDKVHIKSIDWYNKNKDEDGDINISSSITFTPSMSNYCDREATIEKVHNGCGFYSLDIDKGVWAWYDEILEDIPKNKKIKIFFPKDSKVKNVYITLEDNCIVIEYNPQNDNKFIPKVGDIVYIETPNYKWVSIFKEDIKEAIQTYFDINVSNNSNSFYIGSLYSKDSIKKMRIATENEKQKLFRILKENGFKWNKETGKIEEKITNYNFCKDIRCLHKG